MMPPLDELLRAETFFYRAMNGQPQPITATEFQGYASCARSAYEAFQDIPGAKLRLEEATRAGLLRPRREGLPQQILPPKAAVSIGFADVFLQQIDAAADPDVFSVIYPILGPYEFEMAYASLRAYNSLLEIDQGFCAPAGSVQDLLDPASIKALRESRESKAKT